MLKRFITFIKSLFKRTYVFFIGSSDTLPEPLVPEQEAYYIGLSELGDTAATGKLIEHNLRLVVYLSKRYDNTGIDIEDLVSIGTIGLIKGVNTYNSSKNIKLATYASTCINNEILMYLRKNKKRKSEVSLEDSLSYDGEGNELRLEDILGTEGDIVTAGLEKETEMLLLYDEIGKLNKRDKEIMIMRYGLYGKQALTQKDVADLLEISQSYISRIEKKIIKKLKTNIEV